MCNGNSPSLPVPVPVGLASPTAARPQTSEQTQHPSTPPTHHSRQRDQRGLWLRLQDDGWVSSVRSRQCEASAHSLTAEH